MRSAACGGGVQLCRSLAGSRPGCPGRHTRPRASTPNLGTAPAAAASAAALTRDPVHCPVRRPQPGGTTVNNLPEHAGLAGNGTHRHAGGNARHHHLSPTRGDVPTCACSKWGGATGCGSMSRLPQLAAINPCGQPHWSFHGCGNRWGGTRPQDDPNAIAAPSPPVVDRAVGDHFASSTTPIDISICLLNLIEVSRDVIGLRYRSVATAYLLRDINTRR
jgi:hypothetical protein